MEGNGSESFFKMFVDQSSGSEDLDQSKSNLPKKPVPINYIYYAPAKLSKNDVLYYGKLVEYTATSHKPDFQIGIGSDYLFDHSAKFKMRGQLMELETVVVDTGKGVEVHRRLIAQKKKWLKIRDGLRVWIYIALISASLYLVVVFSRRFVNPY